jgi:hypothetical protein
MISHHFDPEVKLEIITATFIRLLGTIFNSGRLTFKTRRACQSKEWHTQVNLNKLAAATTIITTQVSP